VACVFGHFCTLKLKKSRNSASGGDALTITTKTNKTSTIELAIRKVHREFLPNFQFGSGFSVPP
jgi:hypothetical protein